MRHNRWDFLGILVSGLCLAHCLLLPVLLSALPAMAFHHAPEYFHMGIACIAVPAGVMAFLPGFLRHRKLWVPILGCTGLFLLISASVYHEQISSTADRLITTVGGLMAVAAHINNQRLSRSECC